MEQEAMRVERKIMIKKETPRKVEEKKQKPKKKYFKFFNSSRSKPEPSEPLTMEQIFELDKIKMQKDKEKKRKKKQEQYNKMMDPIKDMI